MGKTYRKLNMHEPAIFRICIQGELDESWFDYFGTQSSLVEIDPSGNPVTTIICEPMDQAGLIGLVTYLNFLGIPLISVEPV